LKVRFGDAFIWILLEKKLSADGNQIGEVRIEGWGVFGPPPHSLQ